jgi:hypothetical protein
MTTPANPVRRPGQPTLPRQLLAGFWFPDRLKAAVSVHALHNPGVGTLRTDRSHRLGQRDRLAGPA